MQPFDKNIIAVLKGLGNKNGELEIYQALSLLEVKNRVPMLA